MKMSKRLSIMMLLAFLSFSLFQQNHAHLPAHPHPVAKAIISLDDLMEKAQWDDKKKQPFDLPFLFVTSLILIRLVQWVIAYPVRQLQRFLFLVPIFHQSNYIIRPLRF
ncbi:hypothetical protein [Neobacillus dielmonensis]|uniref:hypothetical protein n=1 Tax=Neobacillus dielmonensis TaxID=1347369 RepID=UPI0005A8A1E6|nr:hypothetical protein [Neobacillus dielmonensis]